MQNLVIDIGNTRLKWAVEIAGSLKRGHDIVLSETGLPELVNQYWTDLQPEHVMISCVADKNLEQQLADAISSKWGISPRILVSPVSDLGVHNVYPQPGKLGSDRWAAMVAAYLQTEGPVCVVDCGSAVTLDAIDATGQHLGGLIVPGLTLARQSLLRGTSMESGTDMDKSEWGLLGQSTEQCIERGCLEQVCGLIGQVYQQLQQQYESMGLILTGGDADLIQPRLSVRADIDPDLVLKGLASILRSQIITSSS